MSSRDAQSIEIIWIYLKYKLSFFVLLTLLLYTTELKIGTNNLQIISDVVKISCHCKYFRTSEL